MYHAEGYLKGTTIGYSKTNNQKVVHLFIFMCGITALREYFENILIEFGYFACLRQ